MGGFLLFSGKGKASGTKHVYQTTSDKIKEQKIKETLLTTFDIEESKTEMPHYLLFDMETTGLPRDKTASITKRGNNYPNIVQLAWIVTDMEGKYISQCNYILKQSHPIPERATAIHGITNERAEAEGVSPEVALKEFYEDAKSCKVVVAHNMEFGFPIVETALLKHNLPMVLFDKKLICTMQTAKEKMRLGEYPELKDLWLECYLGSDKYYIVSFSYGREHDAIIKVSIVKGCFFKMKEQGIVSDDSLYLLPIKWKRQ